MKTRKNPKSTFPMKICSIGLVFLMAMCFASVAKADKTFTITFDSESDTYSDEKNEELDKTLLSIVSEEEEEAEIVNFQIIDENDELVFTGPVSDWEDAKQENLQKLKRKAEFLFRSGNNNIYKIFSSMEIAP
ncbi:MAG: hypothetical protein WBA74_09415 [Cyclobacteriaceae bacterium]